MMNDLIEKWIDTDSITVALKTGNRELAERIDVLQKSRQKLPSYYRARAIFSRIALEQCTSEAIASERRYVPGELAIDLTTGLGVDSYYLSKSFKNVISIEIDPERCLQAKNNFRLLGAENIQTINMSAEEFINDFKGTADLIFVDPARRDDRGNRIYDISTTKPDVISLLPVLLSHCKELCVKCSPMFDVDELRTQFANDCSVETISFDGECKETVVWIGHHPSKFLVSVISSKDESCFFSFDCLNNNHFEIAIEESHFLLSFDVAFVKSRTIDAFMKQYHPSIAYISAGSYLLSSEPVDESMVCCRKITSIEQFHPSKLKKQMKGKSFSVLRKGFPVSMEILKKQLGFKEGGNEEIAFVQIRDKRYTIRF